jgi:hypothetical protein
VTYDDGEVDVSGTSIWTRKIGKLQKLCFKNLEFKTSLETEPQMGGNSKNEFLGNGFRRHQTDSITSVYGFCAGGDKKIMFYDKKDFSRFRL